MGKKDKTNVKKLIAAVLKKKTVSKDPTPTKQKDEKKKD